MNLDTAVAARDLEESLTNFTEITQRLRNGEMVGRSQHGHFRELREHHDAYTILLKMVGQTLTYHPSGFYHITEDDSDHFSERSKAAAVVAYSIIEQLGNKGTDPSQLIDKATVLNDDFIDEVIKDQTKNLRQLNIHHHADFRKVLASMTKIGFISASEDTFNPGIILQHPFHYYLDSCRNLAQRNKDQDNDLLSQGEQP